MESESEDIYVVPQMQHQTLFMCHLQLYTCIPMATMPLPPPSG